MQKQKPLFKWGPLSEKQLMVLCWWRKDSPVKDKDIIICEGAIRSTKTISTSYSFVEWAFATFEDELFGLCGKTIGSLRQNVVDPLKRILHGRGFLVHENRLDKMLTITKGSRTNKFELFGGKDEASQTLIQGRTLAGLLCDEVALMPESFVNQAVGRCSVHKSKIWFNCNPEGPFHWFKRDYIDRVDELNAFHLQFFLSDNLTLSTDIIKRYERMYSGVFYLRYIKGLWVLAEGSIYDMWSKKLHVKKGKLFKEYKNGYKHHIIGIDYGTANPCTFGLYGYNEIGEDSHIQLIREYYHDSSLEGKRQKTDSQYADDLDVFLDGVIPLCVYVDPSALSFIVELKRRGKYFIKGGNNDVLPGIQFIAKLLLERRYTVDPSCVKTIEGYSSYVWDPNAQKLGVDKPLKENDHTCDRDRYGLVTHFYRKYRSSGQRYWK